MTLVFGQQDQSDCDVCAPPCICGPFCSNTPYCAYSMAWVCTTIGANNLSGFCGCGALDTTFALNNAGGVTSYTASDWNTAFQSVYGFTEAKADSTVCDWQNPSGTVVGATCDPGFSAVLGNPILFAVLGTDDKWRMVFVITYQEAAGSCDLVGESLLGGTGDPADCGTPGEGSPTLIQSINLSQDNVVGTIAECSTPIVVSIQGNPQ